MNAKITNIYTNLHTELISCGLVYHSDRSCYEWRTGYGEKRGKRSKQSVTVWD